jgi:hypothetical protein
MGIGGAERPIEEIGFDRHRHTDRLARSDDEKARHATFGEENLTINDPDRADSVAPECAMAEPTLAPNDQPRLDPPYTVSKNDLGKPRDLVRADRAPHVRRELNIDSGYVVVGSFCEILERQFRAILDLPWVELHHQIAEH